MSLANLRARLLNASISTEFWDFEKFYHGVEPGTFIAAYETDAHQKMATVQKELILSYHHQRRFPEYGIEIVRSLVTGELGVYLYRELPLTTFPAVKSHPTVNRLVSETEIPVHYKHIWPDDGPRHQIQNGVCTIACFLRSDQIDQLEAVKADLSELASDLAPKADLAGDWPWKMKRPCVGASALSQ